MLLFQWGAESPESNEGVPVDLRENWDDLEECDEHEDMDGEDFDSEDDEDEDDQELQYLDFVRQINPESDDDGEEFDDCAIQMSITFFYGAATGDEPMANIWIEKPEQIDAKLKAFSQDSFVAQKLKQKPSKITAFVTNAG